MFSYLLFHYLEREFKKLLMRFHSSIKLALAFLIGMQMSAARADKDSVWDDDPPGKMESARYLMAQAENFKLKASQFHVNVTDSINKAKMLKGQADKLQGDKLKAGLSEYKANLDAFKDHAFKYRAHLVNVELQLGHCKESEAEYQAQAKQYSLHLERFHLRPNLPILPPPHICGRLQISEQDASHMANSMRTDQERLMRSEKELADSESKLEGALRNNAHADVALQRRSKLAEEERKLAGEFAELKTEYELLKTQSDALKGTAEKASTKAVHGQVKAPRH